MVLGILFVAAPSSVPWNLLLSGLLGVVLLRMLGHLMDYLWWTPRRLEQTLRAQGVRGTSYRFLIGDLRDFNRLIKEAWSMPLPPRCHDIGPRVQPFTYKLLQEHGRLSMSWLGPHPKVTIYNAELAAYAMSNKFGHLGKLKSFPALFKLIGDGVAWQEGEKWVKHRRILNPAFHLENLKRMLPACSACGEDMVSRWVQRLGLDGSCELDAWPELQALSTDVISRAGFSCSYQEGRRIFQLQTEQAKNIARCLLKIVIPGYMSLPTRSNRRMRQVNREMESILRGIIGKKIQAMEEGEGRRDDLLGLLMESNLKYTDGNGNGKSSVGLTTDEIIEECKLLYFAGMHTTSALLTWTMILLSMYPEWQDCAREEVLSLFGKDKQPEYDGLCHLKIMNMILYEVLRLYPPGNAFIRKTHKEIEIEGVTYPAGVIIELPMLLIHHDPDVWGSDVHEFKPDRFAEGISKASKVPNAFFPFGWGPRICIGQNFALLEAKVVMCMILRSFEFELAPTYSHEPHPEIALHPKHGAQVTLKAI